VNPKIASATTMVTGMDICKFEAYHAYPGDMKDMKATTFNNTINYLESI
jgi:hypothetical protein